MDISLVCNPFKRENLIYLNGKQYNSNSKINEYKNKYIYEIDDKFIDCIVDEINMRNIVIKFTGSIYDFEILQNLVNKYNEKNSNKIKFEKERVIDSLNKREALKDIVDIVDNSELDEKYKYKLTDPIKKALEEEIEIAVIATVSAGKSTLINALIEKEIMPTDINACTAAITTFKNKNIDKFKLTKINNRKVNEEVDLNKLKTLKEDDEITSISMEGCIQGLKNLENIKLVDTPGTNNSDNEEHKKITMNFIKSNKKPIILFLIDSNSLQANDSDNLLRSISDEIKRDDNKIDEDRFIFVVNKSDNYKTKEQLDSSVNILKNKLNRLGILSPRIHFISAYNALVSTLEENDLDEDKEIELSFLEIRYKKHYNSEKFVKYHEKSTLSNKVKEDLYIQLQEAIKNEDYKQIYYILSGVKGLEMSIYEIVDRYKNINLVSGAVNEVYRELKKNELYENIQNKLSKNIEKIDILQKDIHKVLDFLQKSNVKEELKEEIENIKFPEKIKKKMEYVLENLYKEINNVNLKAKENRDTKKEGYIKEVKAKELLKDLGNKILDLKVDLDTECERYIEDEIYKKGQYILDKYKNNLIEIFGSINLLDELNIADYIELSIPSVDSFIIEKTEVFTVKNEKKRWWQFWKPNTVYVDFIKIDEIVDYSHELNRRMREYIENTRNKVKQERDQLIKRLTEIVEDIDNMVNLSIEDLKKICENKEQIEVAISIDKNILDMIEIYKLKINDILSI